MAETLEKSSVNRVPFFRTIASAIKLKYVDATLLRTLTDVNVTGMIQQPTALQVDFHVDVKGDINKNQHHYVIVIVIFIIIVIVIVIMEQIK